MRRGTILSAVLWVVTLLWAYAQNDSIFAAVETKGLVATDAAPHWLVYNQFGFFDVNVDSDLYTRAEVGGILADRGGFTFESEVDVLAKSDEVFLHELYFNASWKGLYLQIGLNEVKNLYFPDELSTGNLFLSNNARTIPKVTAGILKYVDVPLTKGYLQIRGAISQGILESDRPVDNALYHEKYGYVRTQKLPINISFGFNHNALFGGTLNGQELSSNFWEVFVGSSSSDSEFNGDMVNAAGAHFGVFDYGANLETDEIDIDVYYQQPWSRGSGLERFGAKNRDYVLGFLFNFKNIPWLDQLLYENVYTVHQSGAGLSDPFINGVGYNADQFAALDYDEFVLENYGIVADGLTFSEFDEIVRFESNNGLKYGGRESYYTNVSYPFGNTFQGNVIGNSLFLTRNRVAALEPVNGPNIVDGRNNLNLVVSNRVQAHHFAFGGKISDIEYRAKVTYAQHWGTYSGLYGGNRYSWELNRNYFFRDGAKNEIYYLMLAKTLENIPLRISFEASLDVGFGRSLGGILGLRYQIK